MNIRDNTYVIKALLSSGVILNLSNAVDGQFQWGEQKGELAQRLMVTFANANTPYGSLKAVLALCTRFYVYANGEEVFRGVEWDIDSKSSDKRTVPIIAYDKSKYLMESQDQSYYPAGYSTKSIVSDICNRWGIPLNYTWSSWTHPKTLFRGSESLADQITQTIETAQKHLSTKPVVIMDKDTLSVRPKGSNSEIYKLRQYENLTGAENHASMDGLVTRVRILGKEDNDGRSGIAATVNGKTEYGILQKVIYQDGDKTLADAKAEANELLSEKGAPTREMLMVSADVPKMRKGDKVNAIADVLNGYYYVAGITHDAITRTMSLEVEAL